MRAEQEGSLRKVSGLGFCGASLTGAQKMMSEPVTMGLPTHPPTHPKMCTLSPHISLCFYLKLWGRGDFRNSALQPRKLPESNYYSIMSYYVTEVICTQGIA